MAGYLTSLDNDVFGQFDQMRRQMNRLFGDFGSPAGIRSVTAGTFPAINVSASANQVDVFVFAAGLDPNQIELSLQQNLLTISGERTSAVPEGVQGYRRERFKGAFKRTLVLPDDIDSEAIKATYENGVLHVAVKRKEEVQARKIDVK
ncbi:MAG: Hsp20/alpha crystallin family protein [Flavobacteriaceae bacterium TMED42]|nr:MAG: Hsp20/alpha crystallin family protein [Flavobacteriaceae bacterium TMED42]